jgi:hypothetical protein
MKNLTPKEMAYSMSLGTSHYPMSRFYSMMTQLDAIFVLIRRSLSRERGKLSPKDRDSTTLEKLCFYAWRFDAWRGSKTNYQKKPKCLKNERPLQ